MKYQQFIIFSLLCVALINADQTVEPDNENIQYIGRFNHEKDEGSVYFSWPGSQISIVTDSEKVEVLLEGFSSRYLILINGQESGDLIVASCCGYDDVKHTVAENLSGGNTISLYLQTEDTEQNGWDGVNTFKGFVISDGASLSDPPARSTRKLQFIGDSDTVGFGILGTVNSDECDDEVQLDLHYAGNYYSWASDVARQLDAEKQVTAISGIGVTSPMSDNVNNINPFADDEYDYEGFEADAVIMLIGPNDDSLTDDSFVETYYDLMDLLYTKYLDAGSNPQFIHVIGGSGNGFDPKDGIQQASDQFNDQYPDTTSTVVAMDEALWESLCKEDQADKDYCGCYDHYNKKGALKVANSVINGISDQLGWDVIPEKVNESETGISMQMWALIGIFSAGVIGTLSFLSMKKDDSSQLGFIQNEVQEYVMFE